MNKAMALLGSVMLPMMGSFVEAAPPERFMGFNTYAPNSETLRRFAEAGVNTVVCFPANVLASTGEPYNNSYPPIWNGPGIYDSACLMIASSAGPVASWFPSVRSSITVRDSR